MSSLQLPGLSTGIDTKALIDQLMAVERRRLASYTSSVTQYEEKKTAVTELQSKLSDILAECVTYKYNLIVANILPMNGVESANGFHRRMEIHDKMALGISQWARSSFSPRRERPFRA